MLGCGYNRKYLNQPFKEIFKNNKSEKHGTLISKNIYSCLNKVLVITENETLCEICSKIPFGNRRVTRGSDLKIE